MEKGYYRQHFAYFATAALTVAIHNKNGKGLLLLLDEQGKPLAGVVAIHNKNGKGLLH